MDNNKFKFMFLRGEHNFPIGCIAMRRFENRIEYQISTLNPKDRFDRRLARQLALGRLIENPIKVFSVTPKLDGTYKIIMEHIRLNDEMPKRAKVAATKWLKDIKK